MLSLTAEELAGVTEALSHSKNRCVIGSAEALERCGEYELEIETIGYRWRVFSFCNYGNTAQSRQVGFVRCCFIIFTQNLAVSP